MQPRSKPVTWVHPGGMFDDFGSDELAALCDLRRSGAHITFPERCLTLPHLFERGLQDHDIRVEVTFYSQDRPDPISGSSVIALLNRVKHLETVYIVTFGLISPWGHSFTPKDIERALPWVTVFQRNW